MHHSILTLSRLGRGIALSAALLAMSTGFGGQNYRTQFAPGEFTAGPVDKQGNWVSYSAASGIAEIAPAQAPWEQEQVLRLVRPANDGFASAGAILRPPFSIGSAFTFTCDLAYERHTSFGVYQVTLGSGATSRAGAMFGIGFVQDVSPRGEYLFYYDGDERYLLNAQPDKPGINQALPKTAYRFVVNVKADGKHYDLSVFRGEQLLSKVENAAIRGEVEHFNRAMFTISGGSRGDSLTVSRVAFDN